jgi:hypothetical protein
VDPVFGFGIAEWLEVADRRLTTAVQITDS